MQRLFVNFSIDHSIKTGGEGFPSPGVIRKKLNFRSNVGHCPVGDRDGNDQVDLGLLGLVGDLVGSDLDTAIRQTHLVDLVGFDLRNQAAAVTETFHRDVLAGKGGRVIRIARSVGEFVTGRNRTANLVDNVRNQTAGEHLIGIGFRSGLRGHGRIGGVGSPRGRIGHGPGQFREILTGGLPVVVIEEIDVNGLDGQRVQAGSGLHGAHFENATPAI